MNPEKPDKKEIPNNEGEKPKQRDRWDKMQICGQLLLPLVIALVGISFTYYQSKAADKKQTTDKQLEKEKQKTDRVTNLLDHLASDKQKANLMALEVIKYLIKKEEVDLELVNSITGTLDSDESKSDQVVESSTETLAKIADESKNEETKQTAKQNLTGLTENKNSKVALYAIKSLTKIDAKATSNLPARIYLHILKGSSRDLAENLKKRLEEQKLIVMGIDLVDVEYVLNQNELRYFVGSNKDDVDKITQVINGLSIKANPVDLSSRYPNSKVRPRHYEIWFGKNG